jgi:hypothetical protein
VVIASELWIAVFLVLRTLEPAYISVWVSREAGRPASYD